MVRVRYAPSPTGIPHIGNIRTALFNFLFAKHEKGQFILRIEDTDQKRLVKGAEEAIIESLSWLGIEYEGKIIHQSERLKIYEKYSKELLEKKIAYEKEGAIWISIPKNREYAWTDLVGSKRISFKGEFQEDFVILKSDGFPTYHLANVVDDHLMEITHVIRGEEWISSVPKHIYLYESLGWQLPHFAHLPLILGSDKTKLSKRHGAKSVLDYREEGYLKETIVNFLALLGWNPGGNQEIFKDINELIKKFDFKNVNTASPIFDIQKLDWMNGQHIRTLSTEEFKKRIAEKFPEFGKLSVALIELAKSRISTLNQLNGLIEPFVNPKKNKLNTLQKKVLNDFLDNLSKIENWKEEDILEALKKATAKNNVKIPIIYKILINQDHGLPLPQLFSIFGKTKTMEIIKKQI